MYKKDYRNFVRPVSPTESRPVLKNNSLTGTEARKLYLEEVKTVKDPSPVATCEDTFDKRKHEKRKKKKEIRFCEKELFFSVENNDINKLSQILNAFPDRLNILDTYGWSLLMMACQANAVDIVKELLKRGIDTSVRDKAGNSAYNLVIKNKNIIIAEILLLNKSAAQSNKTLQKQAKPATEVYICKICSNKKFSDKLQHLSSTLHNLNASKSKIIPTNYVIPESNRGYQILLKGGWKKETGLGPDGSGKKYPIKAVQKLDKSGLGHKKKTTQRVLNEQKEKCSMKKSKLMNKDLNRQFEINFRREFY